MALIQTIQASDLYNLACNMQRGKQFGYDGWLAIGDYLEQLSEDLGENIEVDIVGICCDYSMAESVEDFWNEHGEYSSIDPETWEDMDEEEKLDAIKDYLQDNTSVVICEENCIIWQAF